MTTITKHNTYRTDDGFDLMFEPVEDTVRVAETDTGYVVRYLTQEPDPQSPETYANNGIFLVHYHQSLDVRRDDIVTMDDVRNWYRGVHISQEDQYWIFPVAAYIHSGVHLQLGRDVVFPMDEQGWDTSHVGCVLALRAEFPSEATAQQAAEEQLISDWNAYLSGGVYDIIQETFDAQKHPLEQDAVWGYVGLEWAKRSLEEGL